jgi:hypothetical protein
MYIEGKRSVDCSKTIECGSGVLERGNPPPEARRHWNAARSYVLGDIFLNV